MGSRRKDYSVELSIDSFTSKGNGLGQYAHQGNGHWMIEVPFTLPGDRVRTKMHRKHSGVYSSFLEEIIQPSPSRIASRCKHFGVCGGCRWQQLPYELQLIEKERIVATCFSSLMDPEVLKLPIIPCDPPWHHRNKMEFSFSSNAAKDHFLGLFMDQSKGKVVNLSECHLVNPWMMDGLKAVKTWWDASSLDAYRSLHDTGSLRTLTMREGQRTGDRMVILTVSGNPDFALNKKDLASFVERLRQSIEPSASEEGKLSLFLRIQQIAKGKQTQFYEMLLYGPETIKEILHLQPNLSSETIPLTFHISPTAFFQPNTRQAEKLYSRALQLAQISQNSVVYDLYCGTGTLGICAARQAKQVLGIELSPEAVLDARMNASNNGFSHVTILKGDVGTVLSQIQSEKQFPVPDVAMVDPPRMGLDAKAIENLGKLKPQSILYISCNPVTQAANCDALMKIGYRLIALQAVDQFPHTVHIENIAILKRI